MEGSLWTGIVVVSSRLDVEVACSKVDSVCPAGFDDLYSNSLTSRDKINSFYKYEDKFYYEFYAQGHCLSRKTCFCIYKPIQNTYYLPISKFLISILVQRYTL